MRDLQTNDSESMLSLTVFSLRSLFTEYGTGFVTRVILRHPLRSWKGIRRFWKSDSNEGSFDFSEGLTALVGLGFCLKPLEPPCLSGRANHDCRYFEDALHLKQVSIPSCCDECQIRIIGEKALQAGSDLYIMTSARDILHDILIPALANRHYDRALLALCRYSFQPFRLALHIVGLRARLFAYADGDCRNYRDWRRADKGLKDERTLLTDEDRATMLRCMNQEAGRSGGAASFTRDGRIFRNSRSPSL